MDCIIAGCRYIDNYQHIADAVEASGFHISTVVSGGAKGVDALGERWARENRKNIMVFSAQWDKYGRGAGPIRNKQMAERAEALIAIWDGKSRGTKNMIEEALKRDLNVHVHRIDQEWWVSSNKMTFMVTTVDNKIVGSAPIGRKFIGQRLVNLLKWMKKQGGLKVHKYDSE